MLPLPGLTRLFDARFPLTPWATEMLPLPGLKTWPYSLECPHERRDAPLRKLHVDLNLVALGRDAQALEYVRHRVGLRGIATV